MCWLTSGCLNTPTKSDTGFMIDRVINLMMTRACMLQIVFFVFFKTYCQWLYFELQKLFSQWQESKDSNMQPVKVKKLRKCNPYFIRPKHRCYGQLLIINSLTLMHNFSYIRLNRLDIPLTLSRASTALTPVDHQCSPLRHLPTSPSPHFVHFFISFSI